jgi:maltose O-acetyltransferase
LSQAMAILRAQLFLRDATEVASTVRLHGRPFVRNHGTMIIRDRALLMSVVATLELATGSNGTIDIGERVFLNHGCSLGAEVMVRIGPRCQIGPHCMLMDNDFHRLEPERRMERPDSSPIVLEENVWLGARVMVLKGVTIGVGSVIAAGSIVTTDIPERVLAMGVPARVIRGV